MPPSDDRRAPNSRVQRDDPNVGRTVAAAPGEPEGKYRVLFELAEGGSAEVYVAVQQGLAGFSKLVVLKMLKRGLANDPDFLRMFLDEARLSARLNHPNIVQVLEVFEEEVPIIVMEYLEGVSFADLAAKPSDQVPLTLQLRVIVELLHGLHYSHELEDYDGRLLGLVHRDMTPHNVLVSFDGRIKILDYGIAKLSSSTIETRTGVIKGKLRYMPPEQIAAEPVDRRADIYAVGVMIWEAMVGKKMWKDMSEANVMNRVLAGDIPRPSDVAPECSPELERICLKAMAYEATGRHATAAELQAELEQFLATQRSVPSARDVGKVAAQLFAAERARLQQAIDTRMAFPEQHGSGDRGRLSFPPAPASLSDTKLTVTQTYSHSVHTTRRRPHALLALGVLTSLALLWAISGARLPRQAAPAERQNAASPQPSTSATRVATVTIRVTVDPPSGTVELDGRVAPHTPTTFVVARSEDEHLLVARAAGYEPLTRRLRFSQSQELFLSLREEAAAAPSASGALALPSASRPSAPVASPRRPPGELGAGTPAASAHATNCAVPYFYDERGIKRYRPECL